ncbi:MAG TPA: lysozyme inhibitor LprI family protein [Roseiarcus sp.]|nr:lysozyme inhibitor LprI family protein [Roseiarcus sp.]
MRRIGFLLGAWLALALPAFGEDCPDQNQQGLNACANAAYKKADDALNGVYRETMRRLKDDAAAAKLLVAAQKAWIAFRDAECAFAASENAGGSIYPMVYAECLERLTKARTSALRLYLKCGEGDLGCPAPGK